MNSLVKLDEMKKIYAEDGIDIYLNGKKSVITLANYKEVQKEISNRRLK